MPRWTEMEDYLTDLGQGVGFNNVDVAGYFGVDRKEGSRLIEAYQDAQEKPNSKTLYVISRKERTSRAVWHAGARTTDAKGVSLQLKDDLRCRLDGVVVPVLRRMGYLNPRADQVTDALVNVLMASLALLDANLSNGGTPPET